MLLELKTPARPALLRLDIEPTERRQVQIDVSERLDSNETLASTTVADGDVGVAENVAVSGSLVTLDVLGLANGTQTLLIITALGTTGSVVRFVLFVRCIDPAESVAAIVVDPDAVNLHAVAVPHHNIEANPIRPETSVADVDVEFLAANNPAARPVAVITKTTDLGIATIRPVAGTVMDVAALDLAAGESARFYPNAATNNWDRV